VVGIHVTDSKTLRDEVEKDFVVRIEDWIKTVEGLQMSIPDPSEKGQEKPISTILSNLRSVRTQLSQLASSMYASKQNLDSVGEILSVRKTSTELKGIVISSWPPRSIIERLTYVAGLLFPAGGVPIALAGGITKESALFSAVMWSVATVLLAWSLIEIRKYDMRKWDYFEQEFEIHPQMSPQNDRASERDSRIHGQQAMNLLLGAYLTFAVGGMTVLTSFLFQLELLTAWAGVYLGVTMLAIAGGLVAFILWRTFKTV